MLFKMLVAFYIFGIVAYAIKTGDTIRYPDETEYLQLARNLANTCTYTINEAQPTAYRPPAYPLLLAAGIKMGLAVTALRVVNASTLLACMGLLYVLLRKTSVAQARIAVLLVMAYPVLLYTANTFYPQIPAAAFFLSALVLLFSGNTPGLRRYFVAGLFLGLTILMVPTFGFVLIFTASFFFLRPLHHKMLPKTVLLMCGAGMVLAPWVVRNALAFDRFIPISTNNGINLLLGNNEHATPNSGTTADISQYEKVAGVLSEIDANDYYTQVALTYIKEHPSKSLKLYAWKMLNYFNYENQLFMKSEQSRSRTLLMLFSYGLLLGLAILRLILAYRHPLTLLEKYIAWLYLLNAPVAAIFFTRIRFRLPMDILLTVLAASAIVIITGYIRSSAHPKGDH
ncbi:MAG: hypothetical protein WCS52_07570 [bacterium]